MNREKVGVVLVNYNGAGYIRDCLDSLLAQTYGQIEIIVWDNHSSDGSVDLIKKCYPDVWLVEGGSNLGFARANNLAVKKILKKGVAYVLLLNVDTIADPMLVEKLVEKAGPDTVTTARIYLDKRLTKNWYAGGELQLDEGNARHLNMNGKLIDREVTFVSGCCMMIHREIIRKTGLFDKKYYLYYEDTDLCMRYFLSGIHMRYLPDTWVWHRVGGSSGGLKNPVKEYYMVRNRLYFVYKYQKHMAVREYRIVLEIILNKILLPEEYDRRLIRAACLGIIDYYLRRMGRSKHSLG